MMNRLKASERRTLLVAFALLTGALLMFRGLPSWQRWNHQLQRDLGNARIDVATMKQSVANVTALQDTLTSRSERVVGLGNWIFSDDSPAGSAAALGSRVSRILTDVGLNVESMQVLSDTTVHRDFAELNARFRASGTYASLMHAVVRLEAGPPMLAVRSMQLRRSSGPDSPVLEIDVTIAGLSFHVEEDR